MPSCRSSTGSGSSGPAGEAALLAGLRHEIVGDRKAAVVAFGEAEEDAVYDQPATRAFALTCHAQLLDVLGRRAGALDLLREACTITEVRRNAAPFLGWSRQGTPIETLLGELVDESSDAVGLGAGCRVARPARHRHRPRAAHRRAPGAGRASTDDLVRPSLSSREREVLNELARGATYADIAASLFVSENTVKTHVSSLYGKLAVSRRSEALAVARNLHLL